MCFTGHQCIGDQLAVSYIEPVPRFGCTTPYSASRSNTRTQLGEPQSGSDLKTIEKNRKVGPVALGMYSALCGEHRHTGSTNLGRAPHGSNRVVYYLCTMPGTIHLTHIATMVFHPENIFFRVPIWSGRQLHHSRRCWAQRRLNARRIHALCR